MGKLITVEFRQDTIFALERDDGVFIAVKPICDALGLNWRIQREGILGDTILAEGCTIAVTPTPGGAQEMLCLKLDLVNGWLLGINDKRVKDAEAREKLLTYKRECYSVLFQHFYGKGQKPTAEIDADPRTEESIAIRRQLVTEARQTFDVHAARELWFKLALPITQSMTAPPEDNLFTYTAKKEGEAA